MGYLTELQGKDADPPPERKKVHWWEPLVREDKDKRKAPTDIEIPAWVSLSTINGRGLMDSTRDRTSLCRA